MYEARSAEYIRITESIAIEFFRRLKINRICAGVPKFDIENINFIVSMAKQLNIKHAVSLNPYIAPDLTSTNNSGFGSTNLSGTGQVGRNIRV